MGLKAHKAETGRKRRRPLRILGAAVLISGGVLGGFGAVTEPDAPAPAANEKAIGSWDVRPFIPGSLNPLIDQFVPPEHRKDLTLSFNLYQNNEVGNYAVASYQLFGNSKFSGTLTCIPGDGPAHNVSDLAIKEQSRPEGIKVFVANDVTDMRGRVFKEQTIEITSEGAKKVCVGGITKQELPQLMPIWTQALTSKFK